MSRRVLTLITGAVLLLALLVGGSQLPVPYAELGPGPTLDTLGVDQSGQQIIRLTGRTRAKTGRASQPDHRLGARPARPARRDARLARPGAGGGAAGGDLPARPDPAADRRRRTPRTSSTSQNSAELRRAGLPEQTKVVVTAVPDDSPSHGKLSRQGHDHRGRGHAGRRRRPTSARSCSATTPGTTVTVDYLRDGKPGTRQDHHRARAPTRTAKPSGRARRRRHAGEHREVPGQDRVGRPDRRTVGRADVRARDPRQARPGGPDRRPVHRRHRHDRPLRRRSARSAASRSSSSRPRTRARPRSWCRPDNCAEASRRPPAGLKLIKVDSLTSASNALERAAVGAAHAGLLGRSRTAGSGPDAQSRDASGPEASVQGRGQRVGQRRGQVGPDQQLVLVLHPASVRCRRGCRPAAPPPRAGPPAAAGGRWPSPGPRRAAAWPPRPPAAA